MKLQLPIDRESDVLIEFIEDVLYIKVIDGSSRSDELILDPESLEQFVKMLGLANDIKKIVNQSQLNSINATDYKTTEV